MKCVKNEEGRIIRVSDKRAPSLVEHGVWEYCPKHEWKEQKLEKGE